MDNSNKFDFAILGFLILKNNIYNLIKDIENSFYNMFKQLATIFILNI